MLTSRLLSLVALLSFAGLARAADYVFTNPAGGDWHNAANWSPVGIPAAGDRAVIGGAASYTVNLAANATVAALTLGGGAGAQTLNNPGRTLTIANEGLVATGGVLQMADGVLSGRLEVAAGGRAEFIGPGTKYLADLALVNRGEVRWTGGVLYGSGPLPGTLVENLGLWVVTFDGGLYDGGGTGTPRFVNRGTFRKTGGTGTAVVQTWRFENLGTVEVQSGRLQLSNSAGLISGQWVSGPGADISFTGGSHTNAPGATFDGAARFAGGTLLLTGPAAPAGLALTGGTVRLDPQFQGGSITDLQLDGATLVGSHGVSGVLRMTDGVLGGRFEVAPGGRLELAEGGTKYLTDLTLVNRGEVRWTGGTLYGSGPLPGTVVSNLGLWTVTFDGGLYDGGGAGTPRFVNQGTFRKTGGNGTAVINTWQFENTGTVEVLSGNLQFSSSAGLIAGHWTSGFDAEVSFTGGNHTGAPDAAFTGAGRARFLSGTLLLTGAKAPAGLTLAGGTVRLDPGFQGGSITDLRLDGATLAGTNVVTGVLTMADGILSGRLEVALSGRLNLTGPGTKYLTDLALVNRGEVSWTGGTLYGSGPLPGTLVDNLGLWTTSFDGGFYDGGGAGTPRFVNQGTFRKTGGAGASVFSTWQFENLGDVEVKNGGLQFSSTQGVLTGRWTTAFGSEVSFGNGNYTATPEAEFHGLGRARFTGGTLLLKGPGAPPGLALAGGTVRVDPEFQGGSIADLRLDGATFVGTNTVTGRLVMTDGVLSGRLEVAPGGILEFMGPGTKYLADLTLLNRGEVRWTGGVLYGSGSAPGTQVLNQSQGLWTVSFDGGLYDGGGAGTPRFVNQGIFRKTGGAGAAVVSTWRFDNRGTVEVLHGGLQFANSAGQITGSWLTGLGADLHFASGTYSNAPGAAFTGAGTARFQGGTLLLTGAGAPPGLALTGGTVRLDPGFQGGSITDLRLEGATLATTNGITGVLTMTDGVLSGRLEVAAGGRVEFIGPGTKYLADLTLVNRGEVIWTGGVLYGSGPLPGTLVDNLGLWTMTFDGGLYDGGGAGTPRFVNRGTFRKTGGAGTAVISTWRFENQGTVEVLNGGLQFSSSSGSISGQWTTGPGALVSYANGSYVSAPGAAFGGAGAARFVGGTLLLTGAGVPPGLALTGGTVRLDPGFQGGSIADLTLAGATLATTNGITGVLTMTDGELTGRLEVAPGGRLELAGPAAKYLTDLTLVNRGEVIWTGGVLYGRGPLPGTLVDNLGLWTMNFDGGFYDGGGAGTPRFVNRGIFRKTDGTGNAVFSTWQFENLGTLDLRLGQLSLNQPYKAGPDSRLRISLAGPRAQTDHGKLQFTGPANFTGALEVVFAEGFVPVAGEEFGIVDYGQPGTDFTAVAGEADQFERIFAPTRLTLRGRPRLSAFRPPEITQQPLGRVATIGDIVVLRVIALGSPAPGYQWRRNGQRLPGETGPDLTLAITGPENAGRYTCVVANEVGAVVSDAAVVTVPAPVLPFADPFAARGEFNTSAGVGVGSNLLGSSEAGEPLHAGRIGGSSVWLSYVAPATGTLELSTFGSDLDTLLAVYTGTSLDALTLVTADDDSGGFYTSRVRLGVTAGARYAVAVGGRSGARGNVVFRWNLTEAAVPPPRLLAPPRDQLVSPGATAVFTVTAADAQSFQWFKDGVALADGGRVAGATAATLTVSAVTLDDVANYAIELRGNGVLRSQPAALQVDPGGAVGMALPVAGSHDKFSDARDDRGAGPLPNVAGPRPADARRPRPGALARGLSGTQVFSTAGAASEAGEPIPCGVAGGASQWFEYLAEADGMLTVETSGSSYDTVLAAYRDDCPTCSAEEALAKLVPLACNNDISPADKGSRMSLPVTNGTIYSLVVDGVNGATGVVKLSYALTAPGLSLTAPALTADGRLQFRVTGAAGQAARIELSTDLTTFAPVLTTNLPAGGLLFTDPQPATTGRLFRAVAP